jgi:hypothetical protein
MVLTKCQEENRVKRLDFRRKKVIFNDMLRQQLSQAA